MLHVPLPALPDQVPCLHLHLEALVRVAAHLLDEHHRLLDPTAAEGV